MQIIHFFKNEKQLIKKSASGNREAQQRLYDTYASKMLGVCRRYVKDVQFAEDVMINGFVKVFKNLGSFRHEGSFEGWIRRIMVRESISYLRKQQFVVYDGEIYEEMAHKRAVTATEIDAEHIQSLIDTLPDGYRTVFVLYAVEGYKHQEIAELLGVSESTSKSQLFKARKLLQEQLRKQNIIGYGTE
ncbi:RNA polymerase sigma factor [Flavobacteriaceae bacterium TP-CH-4]|uniref:RNA polymerase sigma factor n=1 Tax=Pelagihabitans pacificus TaxID=2696054 RepID=A0A967AVX0_9FLAO|nr:RNA polymerase sigma factor [Pelagihabitans pacificus]NHF60909.1 RNA polymerase sigma factor [Pelagihabitans pacificus]